ncbi:MAG TPA: hypothetical protein VKC61_16335, partial [Pyrinomonadaceae bacterium]|nr:hypothetical protein [Pyrinomonadaceae bacterium]
SEFAKVEFLRFGNELLNARNEHGQHAEEDNHYPRYHQPEVKTLIGIGPDRLVSVCLKNERETDELGHHRITPHEK